MEKLSEESPEIVVKEPRELTTIYTCPMCYKKYASLSDLESHISLFHSSKAVYANGNHNTIFVIKLYHNSNRINLQK